MHEITATRDPAAEPTRPNLLYLTHRVPFPPDKGDRIRTFHLLRFLASRANVSLACLADEPVPAETILALKRYCVNVAVIEQKPLVRRMRMLGALACGRTASEGAFASHGLTRVLRQWTTKTEFDWAVASASSLVPYLQEPCLRATPAVVDLIDVDSQKWLDYAAASRGPRSWLYRLEGRRLREVERDLPLWTRAVTLVSAAEVRIMRQFCKAGRVVAVSNGVDLDYFRPHADTEQPACAFVGALDYRPNVDAACWFCERVLPELRRRRPAVEAWLIGRRPTPAVQRLARLPGVRMIGQVADVRPYLARAAVAVVPLRIARGVQNKVLEAMAMARATVASPQALAALEVQPGIELLAASSPAEWVEAVCTLLDDANLRRQLGEAGRCYVEEHHDWDRCLEPFAELLGLNVESPSFAETEACLS